MLNKILAHPKQVAAWVLSVLAIAGAAVSPEARALIMQAVEFFGG